MISGILGGDREATVEFLQRTGSQADWLTMVEGVGVSRIVEYLPEVKVPTLLLHHRGFTGLKEEEAVRLAARIVDAQLVVTEGTSLIVGATNGLQAIDAFLRDVPHGQASLGHIDGGLSTREIEVLRLLSAGKSNQEIADELVISLNTVRRHVSNIFDKTGVANRAEAATYAARNGIS
jgi:DNA-binding CsgD family transcriptional regulator